MDSQRGDSLPDPCTESGCVCQQNNSDADAMAKRDDAMAKRRQRRIGRVLVALLGLGFTIAAVVIPFRTQDGWGVREELPEYWHKMLMIAAGCAGYSSDPKLAGELFEKVLGRFGGRDS